MTNSPMPPRNLVNVSDYGLKGINFYWTRRARFNMSEAELNQAGVFDEHAYVQEVLIPSLIKANTFFVSRGYELIVKDAYRSPELYSLIQQKRYALHGKVHTDALLNMEKMPHANGLTVDINLLELSTGEEVKMRNPEQDPDAFFCNFYRTSSNPVEKEFHRLQTLLIEGMVMVGFKLGVKGEFWHFELEV
jgi:D-alanyl-D-alanine dipeptidase